MSQSLASSAARAARAARSSVAAPAGRSPQAPRRDVPPARPSVRRPPLRVVQAPPTAGSPLGFALLCAALLGAGLIALLLLNTAVAQDSFGLQRLQAGSQQLTDQKQALIQNNDLAASPQQLAQRAWSLGLVPANGSAFVELPSGRVMGVANPAVRSAPPTVITSTNRTTSTKPAAPVIQAGPLLAPASPVAQTAVSGTAPGLAPAAPATTATTTTTSKTTTSKTTPTTTR